MYYDSEDIKVFPTSKRNDSKDRKARIFTEENLTNIVNRLTGKRSFIISGFNIIGNNQLTEGECNLGGYYFKMNSAITLDNGTSENNTAYFYINISTSDAEFKELVGNDNVGGKYTGLIIDFANEAAITDTESTYCLPIAKWFNNKWNAIEISHMRMLSEDIEIKSTDNIKHLGSLNDTSLKNLLENFIIDDGEL